MYVRVSVGNSLSWDLSLTFNVFTGQPNYTYLLYTDYPTLCTSTLRRTKPPTLRTELWRTWRVKYTETKRHTPTSSSSVIFLFIVVIFKLLMTGCYCLHHRCTGTFGSVRKVLQWTLKMVQNWESWRCRCNVRDLTTFRRSCS